MTIQEFKNQATKELSSSPSPALDIQVLLEYITGYTKSQILLKRDEELASEKAEWLTQAIKARKTGLPIAYITGHKEFFGYDFLVSPAVLIPKPDTEILVEKALDIILEKIDARPDSLLTICDMCTGSGCIGIAVMKNLIEVHNIPFDRLPKITMVDISPAALEMAEKNTEKLIGQEHPQAKSLFRFTRSNLFEQVPWRFDVILTNPPYIPHTMVNELLKDGSTNYDNIKWNKDSLLVNYDNNIIPMKIYKYKHDNKEYIVILMNETMEYYKTARPIQYLYEKI